MIANNSSKGGLSSRHFTVQVSYTDSFGKKHTEIFTNSFRIGRATECEICIADPVVSRRHAEVVLLADRWWLVDEGSANGIFVDNMRVDRVPLEGETRVQLGEGGPELLIQVDYPREEGREKEDPLTVTQYQQRYFSGEDDGEAGEHTMMVREAFGRVQKKQKRKYGSIIAVVALLFVIAGSIAV